MPIGPARSAAQVGARMADDQFMGSVLVILFWLWCGVSIVILITRPFYRRMKANRSIAPLVDPTAGAAGIDPPFPDRSAGVGLPSPPDHTGPTDPLPPTGSVATAEPESPSAQVGMVGEVPRDASSVAEVLTGIRLPCDLAPLVGLDVALDPTHVVFATEGHRADQVGQQVGDELERIGCRLTPLDQTTLRADRGAHSVDVRIHPDPSAAMTGDQPAFPTARAGSIVVEFRLI